MNEDDKNALRAEIEELALSAATRQETPVNGSVLEQLQEYGDRLLKLDRILEYIQGQVSLLSGLRSEIAKVKLPELFEQVPGLPFLLLENGSKELRYKKDVLTSIPADKQASAFVWLRENGYAGIIKNELSATFAKGETEKAQAAYDAVLQIANPASLSLKESVHPSTLKAWGLEVLGEGTELPEDCFTLFVVKEAQIKEVKETKAKKSKAVALDAVKEGRAV